MDGFSVQVGMLLSFMMLSQESNESNHPFTNNYPVISCRIPSFIDITGVDSSLAAFLLAISFFCLVQTLEHHLLDRPLFSLPDLEPYEKDVGPPPLRSGSSYKRPEGHQGWRKSQSQ